MFQFRMRVFFSVFLQDCPLPVFLGDRGLLLRFDGVCCFLGDGLAFFVGFAGLVLRANGAGLFLPWVLGRSGILEDVLHSSCFCVGVLIICVTFL